MTTAHLWPDKKGRSGREGHGDARAAVGGAVDVEQAVEVVGAFGHVAQPVAAVLAVYRGVKAPAVVFDREPDAAIVGLDTDGDAGGVGVFADVAQGFACNLKQVGSLFGGEPLDRVGVNFEVD